MKLAVTIEDDRNYFKMLSIPMTEQQNKYNVIYDGNCNLCVSLVKLLEKLDEGQTFHYAAMQEAEVLASLGITEEDCQKGMILLSPETPREKWQGSDAAEEIAKILPTGEIFINFYRLLPGFKNMGDGLYRYIRDNRYSLFGKTGATYFSDFPISCDDDKCEQIYSSSNK